MRAISLHISILTVGLVVGGCSGSDTSSGPSVGGDNGVGGSTESGGSTNAANGGTSAAAQGGGIIGTGGAHTGGLTGAGGIVASTGGALTNGTGGMLGTGGARTGGAPGTGGNVMMATGGARPNTGGTPGNGGTPATGGTVASTGGSKPNNTGGMPVTGGALGTGGNMPATGGSRPNTGGAPATGGARTGGAPATGGARTGGAPATGGTTATSSGPNCSGSLTGGTAHCSSNASGTVNGLTWTIWSSGSGGCLYTYGVGGAFRATWNNSGDFLARVGLQWNETQTYTQLGTVSADFAYTKTGSAGGYSFIGIYGWSNSPLIEYYIVEDWFGSGPPTGGGTLKGTFTADGGTYKVYQHQQTNQPSIHGTATFQQYFSVRQTARQCGHISISQHYAEWASLGMALGKMYEAKILVEAGGGSGSVDFSTATVTAK